MSFSNVLFIHIKDKVKSGEWQEITKNHVQVIEALKDIIQNYGADFELTIRRDKKAFLKTDWKNNRPFHGEKKDMVKEMFKVKKIYHESESES